MAFSKFSNLSTLVLGLALASPAIACVQYSSNLNYENDLLNAALTDNGQQTCAIINLPDSGAAVVEMGCIEGYSASIDLGAAVVTYSYPGFSGSFGTSMSQYPDGNGAYYTAEVWGC